MKLWMWPTASAGPTVNMRKQIVSRCRRLGSNEAGVPAFRECLVEIRVLSDLSNRQAIFYVRSVCPIEQVNAAGRYIIGNVASLHPRLDHDASAIDAKRL